MVAVVDVEAGGVALCAIGGRRRPTDTADDEVHRASRRMVVMDGRMLGCAVVTHKHNVRRWIPPFGGAGSCCGRVTQALGNGEAM